MRSLLVAKQFAVKILGCFDVYTDNTHFFVICFRYQALFLHENECSDIQLAGISGSNKK